MHNWHPTPYPYFKQLIRNPKELKKIHTTASKVEVTFDHDSRRYVSRYLGKRVAKEDSSRKDVSFGSCESKVSSFHLSMSSVSHGLALRYLPFLPMNAKGMRVSWPIDPYPNFSTESSLLFIDASSLYPSWILLNTFRLKGGKTMINPFHRHYVTLNPILNTLKQFVNSKCFQNINRIKKRATTYVDQPSGAGQGGDASSQESRPELKLLSP